MSDQCEGLKRDVARKYWRLGYPFSLVYSGDCNRNQCFCSRLQVRALASHAIVASP